MLEIGIPVYHSKDDLPYLLNSLVNQTKQNFIICLSVDCDGEDYTDIIEEYRNKGLKFRTIYAEENKGPGVSRQRVLDTTFADYIMFCDADDMLHPRAVELLYRNALREGYDIVRGGIEVDNRQMDSTYEMAGKSHVTHIHSTCYKVKYLEDNGIKFQDDLRYNEDTYFNLVAFNCTQNKLYLEPVLYFWKDNKKSITRGNAGSSFMLMGGSMFLKALSRGMNDIQKINGEVRPGIITASLIEIYKYIQGLNYLKCDIEEDALEEVKSLKNNPSVRNWIKDAKNWQDIINKCPVGAMIDNNFIFYKERFIDWFRENIISLEEVNEQA